MATVNSSTPKVFLSQTSSGKSLVIRLKGPKGNLRGVGSRVSLRLKSGRILVSEVHSGSSYLTGSSTDVCFSIPQSDETVSLVIRKPGGDTMKQALKVASGRVEVNLTD